MLFRRQPWVSFLVYTLLRPFMPNSRVPIEYDTLHFLWAEREDERDSSADSPPDRRGLGAAWVTYEGNIENSSALKTALESAGAMILITMSDSEPPAVWAA
ncbi:hypothetical protein B0H13DRAFT_1875802 [Mycena leptocephala]|nr:hypothetical protein B0H13DRAFT_1875802 [Mycena leptocephala]